MHTQSLISNIIGRMSIRYLAIDPGDRRTGLATGDGELRIASPLQTVEATTPALRFERLVEAIRAQAPDVLVLGLPLNMDGSEGKPAASVRALGASLAETTGLPVHFQDERLTSELANTRMERSGLTHRQKKQRRDALAAAAILQDFLDRLG